MLSRKLTATEVLVPYIETVVLPTDVELATRFLRYHCDATSGSMSKDRNLISVHMIAFAARIFIKGIVRYKKRTIIHVHFANFIQACCPPSKLMFSLEQCDGVLGDDLDFGTKFQAYRICVALRAELGIHNRSHMYSLNRAKRYHKEALSDMSTFWLKLMDSKHDIMSLASLTNQITEKRDNGDSEYRKAIQDGSMEREVFSSYALFLETVMLDKKAAESVQARVSELGEELRKSMMNNRSTTSRRLQKHNFLQSIENDRIARSVSKSTSLMSKSVFVVFTAVVFLSIGVCIVGTVSTLQQRETLDRLHTGGMARTLVQIAARQTNLIYATLTTTPTDNVQSHQQALQSTLGRFSAYHNRLTYGGDRTAYPPLTNLFRDHRYLLWTCGKACSVPVGLWDLGLEMIGAFTAVAVSTGNDTSPPSLSAQTHFEFVVNNALDQVSWAYNDSMALYKSDAERDRNWSIFGMTFALVLSLYIVAGVNTVFMLSFQRIGMNKVVAIHLFSLIPYPTQKQLHHSSRDRIKEFDRQTREADKGEALDTEVLQVEEDDTNENPPHTSKVMTAKRLSGLGLSMEADRDNLDKAVCLGKLRSILVRKERKGRDRSAKPSKKKKKKAVTFNLANLETEKDHTPRRNPAKFVEPEPQITDVNAVGLTAEEKIELLAEDKPPTSEFERLDLKTEGDSAPVQQRQWVPFLAVLVAVLFAGTVGVATLFAFSASSGLEGQKQEYNLASYLGAVKENGCERRQAAVGMAATGSIPTFWYEYWELTNAKSIADAKRDALWLLRGDELAVFGTLEQRQQKVVSTEHIALALSASAFSLPRSLSEGVYNLRWAEPYAERSLYSRVLRNYSYGYTTSEADLALSAADKTVMAQRVLSSERYHEDEELQDEAIDTVFRKARIRLRTTASDEADLLEAYSVCARIGAVLTAVVAAGMAAAKSSKTMAAFAVTNVTVFVLFFFISESLRDVNYDVATEAQRQSAATFAALTDEHALLQSCLVNDNALYYIEHWALRDANSISHSMAWLEAEAEKHGLSEEYADAEMLLQQHRQRQLIAMEFIRWICADESHRFSGMYTRPEHYGMRWDVSSDVIGLFTGTVPWFNNTEADAGKSTEQKMQIAAEVLLGSRHAALYRQMTHAVRTVYQRIAANEETNVDTDRAQVESEVYAAMGLLGLAVLLCCAFVALEGLDFLDISRNDVGLSVHKVKETLFNTVVLKCRIAFAIVFVLVVAQYAFAVQAALASSGGLDRVNEVAMREWTVARSAIAADELYVAYLNGAATTAHRQTVIDLTSELEEVRDRLYLGVSTSNITSSENVDRMYIKWLANLKDLSAIGTASESADRTPVEIHEDIVASMQDLIDLLWKSGETSIDDWKTDVNTMWIILVLLSCLLLGVVVVALEVVFRPVVRQLVNEENGTMVLLKMIPAKVRELVPKIAAYIETGHIVDESVDQSRYKPCPIVAAFIKELSRPDCAEDNAYHILEKSPSGIIVSTEKGECTYANEVALHMSGYTTAAEVLGQNVRMFVPETIQPMHQSFLESYINSGVARVVGKGRDVLLLDKYGTHVHVFFNMFEARRGTQLFFVAQLDIYDDLQDKRK
ncbi:transmembrane signaling receptor [Diplonema papillatum]|nr:transmembrane signaling receptor [Diplonema papillatum]